MGGSGLLKTELCVWCKELKSGCNLVKENIRKVKEIELENLYVSLRVFSNKFNFVYGTTQHIVVDILGMRSVASRFDPKILTVFPSHHLNKDSEDLISKERKKILPL